MYIYIYTFYFQSRLPFFLKKDNSLVLYLKACCIGDGIEHFLKKYVAETASITTVNRSVVGSPTISSKSHDTSQIVDWGVLLKSVWFFFQKS